MVFRFLLRFLLSDKVIERLSESYPIRRAAKWVVYFAHKTNAIKGDKISLNPENLKKIPKISQRIINFWQQRAHKSIKSQSNQSVNETRYKSTDTVNSDETNNPVSKSKQALSPEERLKNYIEELKKRTQSQ